MSFQVRIVFEPALERSRLDDLLTLHGVDSNGPGASWLRRTADEGLLVCVGETNWRRRVHTLEWTLWFGGGRDEAAELAEVVVGLAVEGRGRVEVAGETVPLEGALEALVATWQEASREALLRLAENGKVMVRPESARIFRNGRLGWLDAQAVPGMRRVDNLLSVADALLEVEAWADAARIAEQVLAEDLPPEDHPPPRARATRILSMARSGLGDEEGATAAIEALDPRLLEPEKHFPVVGGVMMLHDHGTLDELAARLTKDPSSLVNELVFELDHAEVREAVPAIADRLVSDGTVDCDTSGLADTLRKLDAQAGFDRVLERLPDATHDHRCMVLSALAQIAPDRAVPVLADAIRSSAESDPHNHRPDDPHEAAEALISHCSKSSAVRALLELVDDPLPAVRAAVAETLTQLKGGQVKAALKRLAEDAHPGVRESAG